MNLVPTPIYYEVAPSLENLGITKVFSINKLLTLYRNNGADLEEITCKFDIKDPVKTVDNYLSKALTKCGFSVEDTRKVCDTVMRAITKSIHQTVNGAKAKVEKEQLNIDKILGEIDQLREQNPNLTYEDWQKKLIEKYDILRDTIQNNIPESWVGLEFILSVMRVLNIQDCTLPLFSLLLGRPGSSKTAAMRFLSGWINEYTSDNFTPRSFQSHSTAVQSKEELEKIDMLPKLKNKIFLTPELAPTFSGKEEDLQEKLGIITRIADGHGLASDSGAHGRRVIGDTMLTWVGATVDVPDRVFRILSNLGPKLYFYRLPYTKKEHEEKVNNAIKGEPFNVKEQKIKEKLFDYLKWFEIGPTLVTSDDRHLPKMQWDREADNDDEALSHIYKLAELLSYLRRHVDIEYYGSGNELGYSAYAREDDERTGFVLSNLARGNAMLKGRNHITLENVSIVAKTVLSTTQVDRVKVFDLLLASGGKLTSNRIVLSFNISKHTALKVMNELFAVGLVTKCESEEREANNKPCDQIVLRPKFNWFLSSEFEKLREGFVPTDNREYTDGAETEKESHEVNGTHTPANFDDGNGNGHSHHTPAEREQILISIFDDFERQETEDTANKKEEDKNTVNRKVLEKTLIECGFSEKDAFQTVTDAINTGILELVMYDTLRRGGKWIDVANLL